MNWRAVIDIEGPEGVTPIRTIWNAAPGRPTHFVTAYRHGRPRRP